MIDFRYHLVSLVSVFLALAVGIVLGAGPLQGQILNGVKDQVQKLSDDKHNLELQLGTANDSVSHRDAFTQAITPSLVAGRLAGRSVVVVTLPNSEDGAVKPLVDALQAAGAQVTGRVDIKDAWTATDRAADRQALAAKWRSILAQPTSENVAASSPSAAVAGVSATAGPSTSAGATASGLLAASTSPKATRTASVSPTASPAPSPVVSVAPTPDDQVLEALLARALLSTQSSAAQGLDQTAQDLLDALSKQGMASVNGDLTGRATEAVVIAPGVVQATIAGSQQTPAASPSPDVTPTWTALALALDRACDGTVVVGPASSSTSGGVVNAVRATGDAAKRISTVDTGGTPMGDVTTVYALREQLGGAAGAYGFGKAASAPLPSIGAGS